MEQIGKFLLIVGVVLMGLGLLLMLGGRIPWFGKLPGDFLIQKKNFTFYFPLATSILLSIVLTLIFWILGRK
jgi:hypothetical protein